ncbi:(2Fe-2S)-binding protein [Candidatus Bipolaricaulota bacterium]|nr:(2Fe-2S)-binding protein [Candidatus Bipolaricaulota bacterium]
MSREENGQEVIVCRCRDVTEREVKEAIAEGYDTMELLKRKTMIGTGTCGGRTCLPIVQWILARETGRKIEEIRLPRERSPIVPMPLKFAAGEKVGDME